MTVDYIHPNRTTTAPRPLDYQRSLSYRMGEHFGTSTKKQRAQRADIMRRGRTYQYGSPQMDAAREADVMGRLAYAYGNGIRDAVITIYGWNSPLVETLLEIVWTFSEEYAWHIYTCELHHGGSRVGYITAWERALEARGVVIPRQWEVTHPQGRVY